MNRRVDGMAVLRVMDANLNRAREGLRVCEEVARFVLEDTPLTRRFQRVRADLVKAARPLLPAKLLRSRDTAKDAGHPIRRGKGKAHLGYRDLVVANAQRVEEALRVLEEFTRLNSSRGAKAFGLLRFRVYDLEQDILDRFWKSKRS